MGNKRANYKEIAGGGWEVKEKIIATLVIGIIGIFLTLVRRWKNPDKDAGIGVAGWTVFIILCLWYEGCP